MIDHLVLAGPDLSRAVDHVEARLGVRPVPGGAHPEWGTRNALVSLGPDQYLEVIGPDPSAPAGSPVDLFGIDELSGPRLVTWAGRVDDLQTRVAAAAAAGESLGAILDGRRTRPGGTELRWRLTDPRASRAEGAIPFLIDWAGSPHPARDLPRGVSLISFRIVHPEPRRVERVLAALGLPGTVEMGDAPRLHARVQTARGPVDLV